MSIKTDLIDMVRAICRCFKDKKTFTLLMVPSLMRGPFHAIQRRTKYTGIKNAGAYPGIAIVTHGLKCNFWIRSKCSASTYMHIVHP